MGTESNFHSNKGTMKIEAINGKFANELSNVCFSQFAKELCNYIVNSKLLVAA